MKVDPRQFPETRNSRRGAALGNSNQAGPFFGPQRSYLRVDLRAAIRQGNCENGRGWWCGWVAVGGGAGSLGVAASLSHPLALSLLHSLSLSPGIGEAPRESGREKRTQRNKRTRVKRWRVEEKAGEKRERVNGRGIGRAI